LTVRGRTSFPATGTVAVAVANSTAVAGTGTRFTTEVGIWDRIQIAGQSPRFVVAIANDTSLTVDTGLPILSGAAFTVLPSLFRVDKADGNPALVVQDDGALRQLGTKIAYVADEFVNKLEDDMEVGDVVVISDDQTPLCYGAQNDIPIPEVDLTKRAYDTRVCGIVCQVSARPDLSAMSLAEGKATGKKPAKSKAAAKRLATAKEASMVVLDQRGLMATLGCYAYCKADADIAPIKAGDLLTTSPTRGHAQKVLDPGKALGAIIGKALGALAKGKGQIPVLVMLQ